MAAETNYPASRFNIPKGYTVEPTEDGRLSVYHAPTSTWLGYFYPALCNAQEMVENLIDLHEEEEERKGIMSELLVEPPLPGDIEEAAGHEREHVEELEGLAIVDPEAGARRIRELEIAAKLAAEALERAGDEASAEVVRAVLRNEPSS